MMIMVEVVKMFTKIYFWGNEDEDQVWTLQQAGTAHCTRPGGALTRATAAGDLAKMNIFACVEL